MKTIHSTFTLACHTVHRIDFQPETLSDADLFWLPHHALLHACGKKRKAEHLAGRLAAFHALQAHGIRHIPAIGDSRQPLWPASVYGSISHSGTTALAVVAREPVGIDLENVFNAEMSKELVNSIVTAEERAVLCASGLPFPLALTLAFSAKESAFKAFSFATCGLPGFHTARLTALTRQHITLQFSTAFSPELAGQNVHLTWQKIDMQVVTLLAKTLQFA